MFIIFLFGIPALAGVGLAGLITGFISFFTYVFIYAFSVAAIYIFIPNKPDENRDETEFRGCCRALILAVTTILFGIGRLVNCSGTYKSFTGAYTSGPDGFAIGFIVAGAIFLIWGLGGFIELRQRKP